MVHVASENAAAKPTVDDLSDQIKVLRKDISSLTGTIANLGKSKAAELTGTAREKTAETADEIAARARAMHAQANDFVTAQPGAALGIALGAGFLVGLMFSNRR